MGKRIISQARGKGGPRYRARNKNFRFRIQYPHFGGKGKVVKLFNSPIHSAPLAKILVGREIFYNPAFKGMIEGQEVSIGEGEAKQGNILALKDIQLGTLVYNIESRPGDGGKMIRTGGNSALLTKRLGKKIGILMPSKKEVWINENCKATIGVIAGHGRLDKPFMKAGKKFHQNKTKGKLWPRTSAVKMNVVDHPFGSGRGKNISHGKKGKIPKLNAPPGANVGTFRPRRTGRRKK